MLVNGAAVASADPLVTVLPALVLILAAARLGGDLAERLGQPAVLGELCVGVLLGNAGLFGVPSLSGLADNATIDLLARLGVILLLFEVGLEATVRDMMRVGGRAFAVAVLGVVTPWLLGWGVGAWLLPNHSGYVHAFIGATLTATSVGITARVLKDLGRAGAPEARIILGAAVIDDVLGLVVLGVITSVLASADTGEGVSFAGTGLVFLKAAGFLVGALGLGVLVVPRLFRAASWLRGRDVLLTTGIVLCFGLGYGAAAMGLAPIVGAYAAGLILEEAHYEGFTRRGERPLAELVQPIAGLLAPVFFVVMGLRVDLRAFLQPGVLVLTLALTLAALAGKQACALGAWRSRLDGLSIGIGMIPRGEVGLIFANLGLTLTVHGERILDPVTYSAIVLMVMITTFVTPPALKWSFQARRGPVAAGEDGDVQQK